MIDFLIFYLFRMLQNAFSVMGGSSELNGRLVKVARIIQHPRYNPRNMDYDIAILEFEEVLNGPNMHPVALAEPTETFINKIGIVSGWGALRENSYGLPKYLQAVTVPIMSNSRCSQILFGQITSSMLCAGYDEGGKDSCQVSSFCFLYGGENMLFHLKHCNNFLGFLGR